MLLSKLIESLKIIFIDLKSYKFIIYFFSISVINFITNNIFYFSANLLSIYIKSINFIGLLIIGSLEIN